MLTKYIIETLSYRKNKTIYILKFNLFAFVLSVIYFFIIPILCNTGLKLDAGIAATSKLVFIFLFLIHLLPVSICVFKNMHETKISFFYFFRILKKSFYAGFFLSFFKLVSFIIFILLFRICLKLESCLYLVFAFITAFFYFCFEFLSFWFIPIKTQTQNSFLQSLKKSVKLFLRYPLFTFFVFMHNLILLFFSAFLFMLYPGTAKIMQNMNSAYILIKSEVS